MATKKAAPKKIATKKTATKTTAKKATKAPASVAKPVKKAVKKAAPKAKPVKKKLKATAEAGGATPVAAVGIPAAPILDPIGDTTDGEARTLLADEAPVEGEAVEGAETESADQDDAEAEFTPAPRPPAKLERLQKILSKAGVASRRKAEEMIEQGRVQVNGTVVTELGSKADAGRDHIRVDGKLLHGAERLRYFVLNKPKGFVTTVKDPEGRPTVMQFFDKMRERLYPVGRLDYMSEGLLLMTNDGDLANKLTKAGSGVEKVYLVKVAGQPTEAELDVLRGGVSIERGKPGSPQVRTSPARIRQVRQGDNPWYEVVLIEGRNRELRKMFSAVGHFVEKIRRVGYGPLVLDQEPGNLRELEPQELTALRMAAEGKLRTPKSKDVRRRNLADSQLPTVLPKPSRPRPGQTFTSTRPVKQFDDATPARPFESPAAGRPFEPRKFEAGRPAPARSGEFRARPGAGPGFGKDRPFRPARPTGEGFRPATGGPPAGRAGAGPGKFGAPKFGRPAGGAARPAWKKDDRGPRPPARFVPSAGGESRPSPGSGGAGSGSPGRPYSDRPAAGRSYGARPAAGRTFGGKPAGRPFTGKPSSDKPAWPKPGGSERPPFKKPAAPPRATHDAGEEFPVIKPGGLRIDPVEPGQHDTRPDMHRPAAFQPSAGRSDTRRPGPPRTGGGRPPFDRARAGKPSFGKPSFNKPGFERPRTDRPRFDKPRPEGSGFAKPGFEKPRFEKPRFEKARFERSRPGRSGGEFSGPSRPPRGESGLGRPFTTSSGKPRAGGARPSSKPFKPGGFSKPRPGGFSKSGPKGGGFKGKPGGKKRG